jgi:spermidine/putrescine-binding protein
MLGKFAVRGVLALTVSALVACSSSGSSGGGNASATGPSAGTVGTGSTLSGTLRIFAYSDAFDPSVYGAFPKANPKLNVQQAEISSDEEGVAKLRAGFQADVINSCAGPVDQERTNGDLQPIDTSRITDWNQIYPFFKNIKGVEVNGKVYMLPLVGGAYGLVYRPSAFPTPPKSWMSLFTTDKRISEPDDPLTNIIVAALALGYFPPQSMTVAQLANVKNLLEKQKQHVVTYYQGTAINTLWQQGEVDITPIDITLVDQLGGQDAKFAPMNPPLAWTCGYSIGAKAQNLKAVYAYLNYALSPLAQTVQAKKFSYLVSNPRSAAELPASVLAKSGQSNIENYSKAATFGTPADIAQWTALWQSIKS